VKSPFARSGKRRLPVGFYGPFMGIIWGSKWAYFLKCRVLQGFIYDGDGK
jgi:hypothetical protein